MLSKSITRGVYFWRGNEITEAEYNHIKTIVENRPTAPDGYGYHLTDNLEWELYELPTVETDETETGERQEIRDKINQLEDELSQDK